jgi:hypothetical protein
MIIEERGKAKRRGGAAPLQAHRLTQHRMELPTSKKIIPRLGALFKYERMEVTA